MTEFQDIYNRKEEKVLVLGGSVKDRMELQGLLSNMGFTLTMAPDIQLALSLLAKGDFSLCIVFHEPGKVDAVEFLQALNEANLTARVIVLASEATVEDAQLIMELGAMDFRLPPWTPDVMEFVVKRAMTTSLAPQKKAAAAKKSAGVQAVQRGEGDDAKSRQNFDKYKILTRSPAMEKVLAQARSVAKSKATVLIQGESGTGKELLARFIHSESDRAHAPFVALNCAALPETLLESELFGHEKGAFSGAISRKLGKFELANKGTILLDEVTEMAMPLQAKLLRVLQEGEIDRLGGYSPIPVDVRVIATTNRDVKSAVKEGKFREDLYFRLNVIPLKVPPLRERREDIPFLAEHFREHFVREYGKNGLKFAEGVLEALEQRKWEGNVRELKNIVERGVLLAQGDEITLQDLLGDELDNGADFSSDSGGSLGGDTFNLGEVEKEMIKRALAKTKGNRTHAAKLLGISVRTLRNKLAEYRNMGLVL
ncbi:MAG: sigma-54-dependent Fis family transcriptional regulator [Thermodesulfobacteria bacterium]|nr:sigma-54-dependent Fis family transcriptional regulator [Thermodesulfobacteriota bacterium]